MKKLLKRSMALFLALALGLMVTACGGSNAPASEATEAPASEAASTPAEEPAADDATEGETATPAADGDIVIGVVLKTLASEYWQYVEKGLQAGAEEAGVTVNVVGPPSESDISGQVSMIEDMISQGVSAICVAPNQPDSVGSALQGAIDKGIPVFFIDTDAPFDAKTSFFGPGNEPAAELGGQYAAEHIAEGKGAVIIRGRLGDTTHDQREAGFRSPLEAAGVEVLDVKPGDSQADTAMAVMEDFLQKYGDDIGAVLCCNDEMAQGAQRAAAQAGKEGIVFVGFGGNAFILDPIESGEINATISINPYDMGKTSVIEIAKVVSGETIDPVVDTGASLISIDNLEEYRASLA